MRRQGLPFILVCCVLFGGSFLRADEAEAQQDDGAVLVVGTTLNAPWAVEEGDRVTGAFVEVWEAVAVEIDEPFQVVVLPSFSDLLAALNSGTIDVAAYPLTPTAARETGMDFSTGIVVSGSQIMVKAVEQERRLAIAAFVSWPVLRVLLIASGVLLAAAHVFWRAERGRGSIHASYRDGIFDSLWFAIVTITTVGYGDKVPETRVGRWMTMLWMISSLFVVGAFIAQMTAFVANGASVEQADSPQELVGERVGAIEGSVHADFAEDFGAELVPFTGQSEMYTSLANGEIAAAVANPFANALVTRADDRLRVNVEVFSSYSETFGFATSFDDTESVNRALLKLKEQGVIDAILDRWTR